MTKHAIALQNGHFMNTLVLAALMCNRSAVNESPIKRQRETISNPLRNVC